MLDARPLPVQLGTNIRVVPALRDTSQQTTTSSRSQRNHQYEQDALYLTVQRHDICLCQIVNQQNSRRQCTKGPQIVQQMAVSVIDRR